MTDLDERIAGLSPAKRELLRRRLAERDAARREHLEPIPPSPRRERGDPFPLSSSQERLWFLDQLDPGTPAFNMASVVRLDGALDPAAIEAAWEALVARHESLRTRFPTVGERAVQEIVPSLETSLATVDLSRLDAGSRTAQAARLRSAAQRHRFELRRGPLILPVLLRLASDEHLLVAVMHHIVSDGWSLTVLERDLRQLYRAAASGAADPLPPLPVQYPDFADWQARWLSSPDAGPHLEHWRRQLADLPVLELVTDRPRPRRQTFAGGDCRRQLGAELTGRLEAFAEGRKASLFMVLLAGFQAVLARASGQKDFAVGTFHANRNRPETEGLIGFFVNNLTLRAPLAGNPGFGELVERVRRVTLDAYAHQDVPFEKLLEILHPERDLARPSLFQVMCVLQNVPGDGEVAGDRGAAPSPEAVPSAADSGAGHANFDLTLWWSERGDRLGSVLQYCADLFDGATIERLGGYLERLLAAGLAEPERPVLSLPLLDEAASQQILVASQAAADDALADGALVPQRVLARGLERGDAPAVIHAGGELSYRQLVRRAAHLAERLRSLGVGPESRVALFFDRGPESLVALLAVLSAGGAYVPFDPAHGSGERLRDMLRDAGVRWVLTRASLRDRLEVGEGVEVLELAADLLEAELPAPTTASPTDLVSRWPRPRGDQAAYVIYTSGSTGRPKGVVVSHRALAAYVSRAVAAYEIGPKDRVLSFASLAFDASAEEIWPAWLAGAALVVRGDEPAGAQGFLEACAARRVTVLDLPTAYWHTLVADLDTAALEWPSPVRLVILGGELARGEIYEVWRRRIGASVRLVNTYGPTEATIVATRWQPASGEQTGASVEFAHGLPIGRAVPGMRALALDPWLEPVPPGLPGELCLGGESLARGYHRRPRQTAERFVPDPFGDAERLYRTGDRVRWRGGELEFLGRLDHQVKVRGNRVEIGEIEARLAALPEVRESAVVAVEEGTETALVAYASPAQGHELSTAMLAARLVETLPPYMAPARCVSLDDLPKTAGGKVDRVALARRGLPVDDAVGEWVAPRNETEEVLAEIFGEVLHRDRVGVYESFFDLGGHSLLATQVATRVRQAFDIDLPLLRLFEAPTVARLAIVVEEVILAELEALDEDEAAGAPVTGGD